MIRFAPALLLLAPVTASAQTTEAPVQANLVAPGLRVTDMERSLKFYAVALGLVPAMTLHHGTLTEVILSADSKAGKPALILLRDEAPGKSPPVELGNGFAKVVMRVADVSAVAARMKAAGYPVGEVKDSGHGPAVLMIADPDGYVIELVGSGPAHG
jgi:catechol 2,3-dioxygenase-like lactoylglutathione lyase family enzyme